MLVCCLSVHASVETPYLLQMNVLVDNSLVPFWVLRLLGIPGPSFAISAVKREDAEYRSQREADDSLLSSWRLRKRSLHCDVSKKCVGS